MHGSSFSTLIMLSVSPCFQQRLTAHEYVVYIYSSLCKEERKSDDLIGCDLTCQGRRSAC